MTDQIKWKTGPKYVPTSLLPAYMSTEGLYAPGGYMCEQCGWHTERVGFFGVQASRGHMRVYASTGSRVAWFRALHVLAPICVMLAGFILDLPKNGPTIEVIRVSAAALAIVIAIISKLLNDRLSGTRFALLIIGWLTSLVSMWTIQVPSNLVAIEPMMWASPGGVTAGFWIVEPIARSLRR